MSSIQSINNQLYRPVGPWSLEKLAILKSYLDAYVIATRAIWRNGSPLCFIDLFCGPGRDKERESGRLVDGSPLIAMAHGTEFNKFVFVDIEPTYVNQISNEAAARGLDDVTRCIAGDCNDVIESVLNGIPTKGASFCFIDPAGAHLYWETVQRLAAHKAQNEFNRRSRRNANKIELFILFPYDMAFVRFFSKSDDRTHMDRLGSKELADKVMPGAWWRTVWEERLADELDAQEMRRRFVYMYWMGLKELDYKHVPSPYLVTRPDGHPLYYLYFASDHPAGGKIMSDIFNKSRAQSRTATGASQLALDFEDAEQLILNANEFDFREGEQWYAYARSLGH